MNRTLIVTHTTDRHRQPLACMENLPGEGAEFSAAQLRRLAAGLQAIADDCDRGAGVVIRQAATYDLDALQQQNPFVAYRAEICGGYSTAFRLAALVCHLYNGYAHGVRLDNLLANADARHARIALELMAWYACHGENCPEFMALARELAARAEVAQ